VGFRSYFVWTFFLKTPVPALLAIAAAVVVAIKRRVPWRSRLAFIAAPVAVYLAASLTSSLNIGHRHLLPIYPFLYVMCGVLATEWRQWRATTRGVVAVVALLAVGVS
jgi:hypothetical protein